ncbi:MAG: hypothetical protein M3004_02925 [Bacteroidota bacterium]|nr:hypothetical protein [Bacteroidota bacterium]
MNLVVSDEQGKILFTTQANAFAGINSVQIPYRYIKATGFKVVEIVISAEKLNYKFISN